MLAKIANHLTKSNVAKLNITRQKQFLSWDKIYIVALVIDQSDSINKSELDKFIEATKKYVEVFFVEINSKQATFSDWKCLVKKDKTFLNLPKSLFVNEVKDKKYDLVINISGAKPLYSCSLTMQLNSPFKCGNNNLHGELDLIIERKDGQNLISYLKEIVRYIEMIKTK